MNNRQWHLKGSIITENGEKSNLWVHNGIIKYFPEKFTTFKKIEGFVLPGLVDVHCHLGMDEKGATSIATAQKQAEINLKTGVLAIRDAGSRMNNEWFKTRVDMPTVLTAGIHIARPGMYKKGCAIEIEDENDLVKEAVYQAYRTKNWVKIVADWIDRSQGRDSNIKPLWSKSVLKDAICACHEMGVKVMAHAIGLQASEDLIECGVDTIEHGTGLAKEHMQECVKNSIAVTPTMLIRENFKKIALMSNDKYPFFAKTMMDLYNKRFTQLFEMYDAGVTLLPGSGAGCEIAHGSMPQELKLWVQSGIPTADVVDMSFFASRRFLGLPVNDEYENADLVVYSEDPRKNIEVLNKPKEILLRGKKI